MANTERYELLVGIDWGSARHQIALVDPESGRRIWEGTVPHSGDGLAHVMAELLGRATAPTQIAVALEVPRWPLVDARLERGCHTCMR